MVVETGFEPATLCSQSRCATRLRHSPKPPHEVILRGDPGRSRKYPLLLLDQSTTLIETRWARQDSNLQPSRYERPALPLSYRPSPASGLIDAADPAAKSAPAEEERDGAL